MSDPPDLVVRLAGPGDAPAVAALRVLWRPGQTDGFEARMASWLRAEGDRRTVWLAVLGSVTVGMASVLEYRRMPSPDRSDSAWGYVSNMFVREDVRDRGIGSALVRAIVAAARERGYVRLVLAPSVRSVPFYRRAGFVAAGEAGSTPLLVLPFESRG